MPSKRVSGLFDGAKYSRPVFNVPAEVQKGVAHDIDKLLGVDALKRKRKSLNLVENLPAQSQLPLPPAHDIDQLLGIGALKRKRKTLNLIENLPLQSQEPTPTLTITGSDNVRWWFSTTQKQAPTMPAVADDPNYPPFSAEAPMAKIVDSMMVSFPRVTLRNDEPTEYADVVFSLAKEALTTQIENSDLMSGNYRQMNFFNEMRPVNNTDILQSLRDKTSLFELSTQDHPLEPVHSVSMEASTIGADRNSGESPTSFDDFNRFFNNLGDSNDNEYNDGFTDFNEYFDESQFPSWNFAYD